MANVYANEIVVGGAPEDVAAAKAALAVETPEWFHDGVVDQECEGDEFSATFSSRSRGAFEEVTAFSKAHPDVVVTIAAVDLANRVAEAKVLRDGDMIGGYEMSDEEIEELDEGEGQEGPVMDGLFSTVAAYSQDEMARMKTPAPRP